MALNSSNPKIIFILYYSVFIWTLPWAVPMETLQAKQLTINGDKTTRIIDVGEGGAKNSVNAVIFRKNSLVTHGNSQYIAYYDPEQYVVIGKRQVGSPDWEITRTAYKGKATDAHNAINIMVDGDGFLHVAWDHHNDSLRYAKSTAPGSLLLTDKMAMTGKHEDLVTYPEFYRAPDGNLYFFYRYGASGNGNLVINTYDTASKNWEQLQDNLIDGENQRNAYWQTFIDESGTIHVSWVWRETWDVATNHDMCYARSKDGGLTWENSQGKKYDLPITLETAEVALTIPQNSELINQTSMTADERGNPIIATYYRKDSLSVPQYYLIYKKGGTWTSTAVSQRKTDFSLSGGGTKKIPIARPQILTRALGKKTQTILIYRDEERGNKPTAAVNKNFPKGTWEFKDLASVDLGSWEPSLDTELWKKDEVVHLFLQKVIQEDGEGISENKPQTVSVLEWTP